MVIEMNEIEVSVLKLCRHGCIEEGKMPIKEFHLEKVLDLLKLSHEEFVDLCILLGCDYCDSIRNVGPKRAIELISKYRNLDEILSHIDKQKYPVPDEWRYKEARNLFLHPEVADANTLDIKWNEPDEESLIQFMVTEKNFSEDRIRNGIAKLKKGRTGSTQGRIDSFFTVSSVQSVKRKAEESKTKKQPPKKVAKSTTKPRK